eukprot:Tbor_TRINITY_DN2757_c0_g1::TRINITY_DN2757_c0_g1_i2::g.15175::m.15175/K12843/PRPF3, PRP3; U4/U6 small nuclear ribonucleoprotein PRP3
MSKRQREPFKDPIDESSKTVYTEAAQSHPRDLAALLTQGSSRYHVSPSDTVFRGTCQRSAVSRPQRRVGVMFSSTKEDSNSSTICPIIEDPSSSNIISALVANNVTLYERELERDKLYLEKTRASIIADKLSVEVERNMSSKSLLLSMFGWGIPDIDPLDTGYLSIRNYEYLLEPKKIRDKLSVIYHPKSFLHYSSIETDSLEGAENAAKLFKTPDEIKSERHMRRLEKRAQYQQRIKDGSLKEVQRYDERSLHTVLKDQFSSNPIRTHAMVNEEKERRLKEHLNRNEESHRAALNAQAEKRELDRWRDVEKPPVRIHVYRVFPIREVSSLNWIAKMANNHRMRGLIAWIDQRDAIVILCGGAAPMRDLNKWILHKMEWRPSAPTEATISFCTTVDRLDRFSFHTKGHNTSTVPECTKKEEMEDDEQMTIFHKKQEHVFVKSFVSIEETKMYFRYSQPEKGPWPSMDFVWESAMGLGESCVVGR